MKRISILLLVLALLGCEFADEDIVYEQKLVVYANLSAGFPMGVLGDTCFVSLSAAIDEETETEDLYISDATVTLSSKDATENYTLSPVSEIAGRYLADSSVIFNSGKTYVLDVAWREMSVTAETIVPTQMEFKSPDGQTYICDSELLPVDSVYTENLDLQALANAESLEEIFQAVNLDSISDAVYRNGGCYTESFASFPLFLLDYEADENATIKVITYALETDARDLEPFDDLNGNGEYNPGEDAFLDYNRNGARDSSFSNLIYDTTLVYLIWKEQYLRDQNNDPYRLNPFMWQVAMTPIPMSWLYFNYYGLHMVTLQTTDQAYHDYYAGDPVVQNQYVLPTSNIIGGYGLFSSTTSKSFLVNIVRDEDSGRAHTVDVDQLSTQVANAQHRRRQ